MRGPRSSSDFRSERSTNHATRRDPESRRPQQRARREISVRECLDVADPIRDRSIERPSIARRIM